ncbi:MAG: CHAD domain-containing protein, partial [Anaerolineae bacterium]|nr:CHAD domain-containing protein [Anaerolineae bacterium]
AKFIVSAVETFRLLEKIGELVGFTLGVGKERRLQDTYLDTPARDIQASGYILRQRTQATGEVKLTLKALDGGQDAIHRREELEIQLEDNTQVTQTTLEDLPPGEVRERVLAIVRTAPLMPLFSLSQTRIVRAIYDKEKKHVADLSLDQVSQTIGTTKHAYLELEIELEPEIQEDVLGVLVIHLQDEWGLEPQQLSKFERAMQLLPAGTQEVEQKTSSLNKLGLIEVLIQSASQPGPPPAIELPQTSGVTAGDTMTAAAHKTLSYFFKQMLYHEPGTRLGEDIEELHDMRVATRRMRAAISIFETYLCTDNMSTIVKGLRNTGRALGRTRDLDVFWEKTEAYLKTHPPRSRPDLTLLHIAWENEREKARAKMLEYLDSKKYRRFIQDFAAFTQAEPAMYAPPRMEEEGEPIPWYVRDVVPVLTYQELAAVYAYDDWVGKPTTPLEYYHRLRIASKRLRYTLEYFKEILSVESHGLIKQIKVIQDHLGAIQDAIVARDLLKDFLIWGTWKHRQKETVVPTGPVEAPGVELYLKSREEELGQRLETFPLLWESFRSSDFNSTLAYVIAHISKE